MAIPVPPACRRCGAPAERGQEYCLECGSRLLPARRAPSTLAWLLPSAIAFVVAAAGAAAAIGARNGEHHRAAGPIVALSRLQPLPPPGPPPAPAAPRKPGAKQPTDALVSW